MLCVQVSGRDYVVPAGAGSGVVAEAAVGAARRGRNAAATSPPRAMTACALIAAAYAPFDRPATRMVPAIAVPSTAAGGPGSAAMSSRPVSSLGAVR